MKFSNQFNDNDPEFLEIINSVNNSLPEMFGELGKYACQSMKPVTCAETGKFAAMVIPEISSIGNMVAIDEDMCDMKFICSMEDVERPTVFNLKGPLSDGNACIMVMSALAAIIKSYKAKVGAITDSEEFKNHIANSFSFGDGPMFNVSTETRDYHEQILSPEVQEYLKAEGLL